MASPSSTATLEQPPASPQAGVLVVGLGNPVAAAYAAHARLHGQTRVNLIPDRSAASRDLAGASFPTVVVFLEPQAEKSIDALAEQIAGREVQTMCIVSSYRVHLDDATAAAAEAYVLERLSQHATRTVVLRASHVLSQRSRASTWLRRLGGCYPLVPHRMYGVCVAGSELFEAIDRECQPSHRIGTRHLTLLGPNRSWRDILAEHRTPGAMQAILTVVSMLLSYLLVGHAVALVLGLLAHRFAALRVCNVTMLRPTSPRELLALYNSYNYRHVKLVGYNNGVVHFGQRHPRRTLVTTTGSKRIRRIGDVLKVDGGVTIREAMQYLAGAGQELPVVPNYSYVCLGTAFFVPIHGSAAEFTTVADTITKVILYDPVRDQVIVASRDDVAFRDYLYDLQANVLLLRLYLRVQPRSGYVVNRQSLNEPSAEDLLTALSDSRAANVEMRKGQAAGGHVEVSRYYKDGAGADGPVLDVPRDALGSLWDRLEANAVTSFLFHLLVRRYAWHVEAFLSPAEFATFWQTHRALPLKKIQLRYIRRDGFPKSPFRDHDCVSADMFMLRKHRAAFEAYVRQTIPNVRMNPGKHSA